MPHKKPPSETYLEWERLVFQVGYGCENPGREPVLEQVEGWKSLYVNTYQNGHWTISEDDAVLVAMLGWTIAMRQVRFNDAVVVARQFFAHPNATGTDEIHWHEMIVNLGLAQVLAGQVEEGIQQLQDSIARRRKFPLTYCLALIRGRFTWVLEDLGRDKKPDPRIAMFITEILGQSRGQTRKARLAEQATTNAELIEILIS